MVGSFFRSKRFLTPAAIPYLYKSQIRPRMEYCCHIWAGASQQDLSCLDRVQSRLRYLVGDSLFSSLQPLSHRRNVASLSLLYRYYNGKCSKELQEIVPPRKTFVRNTRFASNAHPISLRSILHTRISTCKAFSQEQQPCGTHSLPLAFQTTITLFLSRKGLIEFSFCLSSPCNP